MRPRAFLKPENRLADLHEHDFRRMARNMETGLYFMGLSFQIRQRNWLDFGWDFNLDS